MVRQYSIQSVPASSHRGLRSGGILLGWHLESCGCGDWPCEIQVEIEMDFADGGATVRKVRSGLIVLVVVIAWGGSQAAALEIREYLKSV